MASFGYKYFISQLVEVGAIQNVSDRRLTRISNISIGLVLAATAVGEFTDNEILQWVRKGRRMTPLIKEQYDMFRDLSQYLMNCVEENDFESWKELLDSCRYVCPTKKTECSSIFGKVSQFCLEVKSTTHSNEAEEYDDNQMVMKENCMSSNKDTPITLNTKDKQEEEKQNSSKNKPSEYPQFVKRNELSSKHFSTIKDIGQFQEPGQFISLEEIRPPLEKVFEEEKIEKNFGKHASKKKSIKPVEENPGTTSVFSKNDEYNLNYKVTSLNQEPTSIEEPCTSSHYVSMDNSNLPLNNNEYDSDDSLEEEEMSVEIIDNGLGNLKNVFDTLKENDLNKENHLNTIDNEIKELAKNVSEKLKDSITNNGLLKDKEKDKDKDRETEVVKNKKVLKETITNEKEEIMVKESDVHEDRKQDLLREREEDAKENSISDTSCTVEAENVSDIIEDKRSQISPCCVLDEISNPVLMEGISKDVLCNEDVVMVSTKDDNVLHNDNIHFDNLKNQDIIDKGEVHETDTIEKIKPVKQSVNEEVVCEKKTDQEESSDNQIKENICEGKGEFSDEFLEDLLFKEIDTSDTDNEMDNSEQTDLNEQARSIEYENLNCNKNLEKEKLITLLEKSKSIQKEKVDHSISMKRKEVYMNISEKEDLTATDISEGAVKGSHTKEETVEERVILEKFAHHKDQESRPGKVMLVENRVADKIAISKEEKYMKLMEYEDIRAKEELEREDIMEKVKQVNQSAEKELVHEDARAKDELERDNITEKVKRVNQSAEKELVCEDANDYKESKTEETLRNEVKALTETKKSHLEKAEGKIEIIEDVPLKEIKTCDKEKETKHVEQADLTENKTLGLDKNRKIIEEGESIKVKDIFDKNDDLNYVLSSKEQDVNLEILEIEEMKTIKAHSKDLVQSNNENRRNKSLEIESNHKDKESRLDNDSGGKTISCESKPKEYIQIDEEEEDVEILNDERLNDVQVKSNFNNDVNKINKDIEDGNDANPLIIDENIEDCNTEKVIEDEIDISKDDYVKDSSRVEKVVETNDQKQSEVMIVDLSDEDADIELIEDQRNILQEVNDTSVNNTNAKASENLQTVSSSIGNEDEITEINNRIVDRILQVENNGTPRENIQDEHSQPKFNENSNSENEQENKKEHEILQKQNKSIFQAQKKSSPLNEEDMAKEVEVEIVDDDQLKQLNEGGVVSIEGKSPIKDKPIVYGCENSIMNSPNKELLSNENVIEIIDTDDEIEDGEIIDTDDEKEDGRMNKEKREKRKEKRNEKGTELDVLEKEEESQNTPSIEEVIEQTKRLLEKQKLYKTKEKCLTKKRIEKETEIEVLERKNDKHITTCVTPFIDVSDEEDINQKNIFKKDDTKEKGQENNQKSIFEIDTTKGNDNIKKISKKVTEVEVLERTEGHPKEIVNVEDAHEINQVNMLEIDEVKGIYLKDKKIEKRREADNLESSEKHIKTSLAEIIDVDDENENNSKKILQIDKAKENDNKKGFEKKIDVDVLEGTEKHTKKTITENIDANYCHVGNKKKKRRRRRRKIIGEANMKGLNKESIVKGNEADVLESEEREIETNLMDVIEVDNEHDNNQKNTLEIEKKKKITNHENSVKKETVSVVLESKEKPIKASVKGIIDVNFEQESNQMNIIQNNVNDNIEIKLKKDKVEECNELLNQKYDFKNDSHIFTKDITDPIMLEAKTSKYEKIRAPSEEKLFESSKAKHENSNKPISLPAQYDSIDNSSPLNEDIVCETANIIEEKNSNRKLSIANAESVLSLDQLSYEENKNSSDTRTVMRLPEESIAMEDNCHNDKKRKSLEIAVPNNSLELPGRKKPKLIQNFGTYQNNEVEFRNLNRKNGLDIIIPIIKNCGGTFLVKNGKIVYSFPNPERANSVVKVLNEFRFPDKHLEVCLVDDRNRKEDCEDIDFVKKIIDKEVRRNEDLFTIFIKYLLKNSIALKDCEFYSSCWQDIYVQDLKKSFQYLQKAVNSLLHINTGLGGVYILVVSPSSYVLQWLMSAISKDLMLVKSCKRDNAMASEIVTEHSHTTGNKILLSTPEEAVELMLDSNNVSETLSALILDDASCLMVKHYLAMRRLANLLSFTKRQTQRGLNIVAVAEEVVEENVKTLSQIFNSNFIIQDGNLSDLTKKPASLMTEKEDKKDQNSSRVKNYLKCLSSKTEKDKNHQKDSSLIKSYGEKDIGTRLQMSKDEILLPKNTQSNQKLKHQAGGSNRQTSTSEEFTVTSESSEIVSSTEIITQQIITKKTIVNTVNKHYTFGKNEDCSSHIIRKDHSDSSSDAPYDQNDQNPNRFENDRSDGSWIPPNKSQNTRRYDSRNFNQDHSSSNRSNNTDRSVWRSGAVTPDTIRSKQRRESSELSMNSRSNSLENLPSHSKHDFTNKNSNFLDQQNLNYQHSGTLPSTSNMEISSKSSREIVPKERFRNMIDPFREGFSDSNHSEQTQNRNDSFRFNRYENARNADSYMISHGQYEDSSSGRSYERSSDYSRNSTWSTQNLHLQGGSRTIEMGHSNMLLSGREGNQSYNKKGAGAVGRSVITDHSQHQSPYQDTAARFSPYIRQPRDRDSFHTGSHGPRDRDTLHSGPYGPQDRDTFNRGSYNQRFNTSSDSDHRVRRRDQSGGYWK